MIKTIFSIFLFLLFSPGAQAQMEEEKVDWKENGLTWADFRANPDLQSPFSANTSSGISYSWSMKSSSLGKEYTYAVSSYFIPGKSWVKRGNASVNLLAHEQLHFDITELHARKLRKEMVEFDFEMAGDVKAALQAIYQKTEADRAAMQKKFDMETQHSMNEAAQLEWQKFISTELEKLEKFSS